MDGYSGMQIRGFPLLPSSVIENEGKVDDDNDVKSYEKFNKKKI